MGELVAKEMVVREMVAKEVVVREMVHYWGAKAMVYYRCQVRQTRPVPSSSSQLLRSNSCRRSRPGLFLPGLVRSHCREIFYFADFRELFHFADFRELFHFLR